ncbi:hypothetical protein F4861DRAFT_500230 [Xylaria intraflava]|nr:hypothetical protein F4861DRAFT_500230 [Xylaria intraflava]
MRRMQDYFVSALSLLAWQPWEAASMKLNVTAIGAQYGSSTLECWQMDAPFVVSSEPGTAGSAQAPLGNVANISYSILPANFDGGVHNAPHAQYVSPPKWKRLSYSFFSPSPNWFVRWVIFTSGLAFVTLPDDETTSAYVSGGEFGLLFAADTPDVSAKGHRTQYPGMVETIGIQIPTADGQVPKHDLLHMGPCNGSEIAGVRQFGLSSGSTA